MPKDASGTFRPNHQLARQADRAAEGRKSQPPKQPVKSGGAPPPDTEGDSQGSQLTANGDGTYSTTCDGQTTQHPTLGSALVAMAASHEPEGTHVHLHSDGMGVKMAHSSDGGESQSSDHESPEEAGQHAASVMNGEDGAMPSDNDGDEGMGMSGMSAMMRG